MENMTDRYQRLRDALAAGPTPGPWRIGTPPPNGEQTIGTQQGLMLAVATTGIGMEAETLSNATYIAAADPETIRALLDRLTSAEENVRKSTAQAEHFEREWYLRGDEIERLRGVLTEAWAVIEDDRGPIEPDGPLGELAVAVRAALGEGK